MSAWPTDQLDIAEGIDPGIEEVGDDGRGLVFGDDGGAGYQGTGPEISTLMDCDLDEFPSLGVEDLARAQGLWSIWLSFRCDRLVLGGTGCGKKHDPAQHLDFHTRDDPMIEAAIASSNAVWNGPASSS